MYSSLVDLLAADGFVIYVVSLDQWVTRCWARSAGHVAAGAGAGGTVAGTVVVPAARSILGACLDLPLDLSCVA